MTEPSRDTLLIDVTLGGDAQLGVHVLLAPHLGGSVRDNVAEVGSHRGRRVPWGEATQERPGYQLVWPRDLVDCAGALLALSDGAGARNILRYLLATQRRDGSWFQNQ